MNKSFIRYVIGTVLKFEAIFLLLPALTALIYSEREGFAFLQVAIASGIIGILCTIRKPSNIVYYAKDGLVMTGLSWIILSIVGAIPFVINKEIPHFVDALFETVSGFTTTGASILTDVEAMSHAGLLWRSFTHWVGGMGILVFVLAISPFLGTSNMYLMKAESPGPSVGKLVPKIRSTALILYGIYCILTIIQLILLIAIGHMPIFDAITATLGTAGTGGFAIKADSMASYTYAAQTIMTIFMFIFGTNFSIYFLILARKAKQAFSSDELKAYLIIIAISITAVTINISSIFPSIYDAFHHAAFQVSTIMSTTGYATTNFDTWPELSRNILVVLMFIGACAGSTAGGLKVSRLVILFKSIKKEIERFLHPRSVRVITIDGKKLDDTVVRSVHIFFATYLLIYVISLLVISLDNFDYTTNITAVAATLNNVGPGLSLVGPAGNFSQFSILSKLVMTFDMLAGRLELFPLLLLFIPRTWEKA